MTITMACKKQGLALFDDQSSQNSIYFPLAETATRFDFSFGYIKPDVPDTTLKIVVRAIGSVADHDRAYHLSIADSSTMKAGLDYQFMNEKFVIKAGAVADTLRIKMKRNAGMKKDSLFMYLDLKPNENFVNSLLSREEVSGGKKVTKYFTRLKVKVDDIAGIPWFWTTGKSPAASFVIAYLGTFGTNKFQTMISRYGLDVSKITAEKYIPPTTQIIGWANGMKAYLDQMTAMGTPVYETDGSLMKMGLSAK
ncbi:protein of unknown function [Pedobacter caeni]|uniref:DUF4843 domain-containing protein n=2 Tax=Pedobacter caeni TaxID=288992 RepID=A0A1M5DKW1_9SPHI|nr:protein of unknown function [Pedobacter caeni]